MLLAESGVVGETMALTRSSRAAAGAVLAPADDRAPSLECRTESTDVATSCKNR